MGRGDLRILGIGDKIQFFNLKTSVQNRGVLNLSQRPVTQ